MSDFDLTLSPETIQEYANASDRNLTAPSPEDNPSFRGGKEAGLGSWTEVFKIHDTDIVATKGEPNNSNKFNFVITLAVLGPGDGGYATNAGRVHYEYAFIDKAALMSTDTKVSGGFKRRLAVINSFLTACGVDLGAGVPSYKSFFKEDKPLVGLTVAAVVRKYRNNKTGDTGINIDGFMPMSA